MGETSSAGPHGRPQGKTYGAALTTKQFFVLVTAIALGTLLEWYEFFVYAQLNAYLTKVFFPSSDPAVQQLSYWGVYAVGFIARPIGSIIFGHIGDTRGRRLNLLLTIIIMAVPTVLIGCLPTFDQIGIAAPALLAVLRLIQGLAMGGEFGSAMVYLHEIAPANMKGMMGSLGFCSAMFGCMLGVLIVVIMEAICSPSQMLVFGWRIPFLLSAVSATAAVALRMKMPEPHEFVEDRQTTIQHNLERIASGRSSTGGLSQSGFSNRFASSFSRQLSSFRSSSKALGSFREHSDTTTAAVECTDTGKLSTPQTTHDLEKGLHTDTSIIPEQNPAAHEPISPEDSNANPKQNNVITSPKIGPTGHDTDLEHGHSKDMTEAIAADDVTKQGEYIPVVRLLRHHTPAVLLQFLFEAWVSVGFWVITTWLPIQMRKAPINMPEILTQAMLIVNLIIMAGVQVASGWLSDKGVPRVWFCFGIFTVAAGISCPVLLEMPRAGIAGAWLLHMLLMVIMAFVLGVIPATLSTIYPPSVRATGFNLGHNMAMSWLGGVSPTVVTALVAATGRTFLAPGLLLTASAGVSMVAALVLVWYAPEANGNTRRGKSAQLS